MAGAVFSFPGRRVNSILYCNQYALQYQYQKKGLNKDKLYLICNIKSCPGSAVVENITQQHDNGSFGSNFACGRPHNHIGNSNNVANNLLRRACTKTAEDNNEDSREIFNRERERFPCSTLTFSDLENIMYRARKRTIPVIPRTVEEFQQILETDRRYSTSEKDESWYLKTQHLGVDGTNVVFVSPDMVEGARQANEFHIDGTFKVVPLMFHQLLTVHFVLDNQCFPVIYALMTHRTETAYTAILRCCREDIGLVPNVFITDYEGTLLNSMSTVFPEAQISGSLFHFNQAIWRKVQRLSLTNNFHQNPDVKKVVKLCMALPLLPAQLIEEGMTAVEVAALETAEEGIVALIEYMYRYWLNTVGSDVISVHKQQRRTNIGLESFHKQLSMKLKPDANALAFTNSLQEVNANQAVDYLSCRAGRQIRKTRKATYVANDRRVRLATESLTEGNYTVAEFLATCSHVVGGDLLQLQTDGEEEDEEPLPGLVADTCIDAGGQQSPPSRSIALAEAAGAARDMTPSTLGDVRPRSPLRLAHFSAPSATGAGQQSPPRSVALVAAAAAAAIDIDTTQSTANDGPRESEEVVPQQPKKRPLPNILSSSVVKRFRALAPKPSLTNEKLSTINKNLSSINQELCSANQEPSSANLKPNLANLDPNSPNLEVHETQSDINSNPSLEIVDHFDIKKNAINVQQDKSSSILNSSQLNGNSIFVKEEPEELSETNADDESSIAKDKEIENNAHPTTSTNTQFHPTDFVTTMCSLVKDPTVNSSKTKQYRNASKNSHNYSTSSLSTTFSPCDNNINSSINLPFADNILHLVDLLPSTVSHTSKCSTEAPSLDFTGSDQNEIDDNQVEISDDLNVAEQHIYELTSLVVEKNKEISSLLKVVNHLTSKLNSKENSKTKSVFLKRN